MYSHIVVNMQMNHETDNPPSYKVYKIILIIILALTSQWQTKI